MENALEKSAQSPKPLKTLVRKKTTNLELEDEIFCYIISRIFRDAYFRAMLILRCHCFWKSLFSIHAYIQAKAYYRENTVCEKRHLP